MATANGNRNFASELMALATEVDSLAKALARTQEELARESTRRRRLEQEAVDLANALAQARERAKVAERDVGRLSSENQVLTQTAQVREHELQTRLREAETTIDALRRELESNERRRVQLETDLADVMQNLRHAAVEAAWPSQTPVEADAEPTRVGW